MTERIWKSLDPPKLAIHEAVEASQRSPCKSKRGAVVFFQAEKRLLIAGIGFNQKPPGFECDGSEACKRTCRAEAVHAEQVALLNTAWPQGCDLLHVKTVDGALVASGPPSCVQCSKLALAARIDGVWLYHADGWYRYPADRFHALSLQASQLEHQRLRAALQAISALDFKKTGSGGDDFYSGPGRFIEAHRIASEALAYAAEPLPPFTRQLSAEEFEHLAIMGTTPDGALRLGPGAAEQLLLHRRFWNQLAKRHQPKIDPDAMRRGECGVIGYPQGERRVCRRAAHHERDGVEYHKDGSISWLGCYGPTISELDRAEEERHGVLRCNACGEVRDPLDGCPNKCQVTQSVGAVARSASSQAEPSTRVAREPDLKGTDRADENHLLFHAEGLCGATFSAHGREWTCALLPHGPGEEHRYDAQAYEQWRTSRPYGPCG